MAPTPCPCFRRSCACLAPRTPAQHPPTLPYFSPSPPSHRAPLQNPALDVQWIGLANYRLPKICQLKWLAIPECSQCEIIPKEPVVPPHNGRPKF